MTLQLRQLYPPHLKFSSNSTLNHLDSIQAPIFYFFFPPLHFDVTRRNRSEVSCVVLLSHALLLPVQRDVLTIAQILKLTCVRKFLALTEDASRQR
ncbi:hypothetical protein CEXT_533271 [Caerostris extrusa]|uniref:Uncharacterized protein n=1 Tax=Caerostris extrusa TaxID=172846 RepID=A0AAV4PQU3_CAEEX|nr:hypothetical protein CEXT_533271 [Caerostris extrusa]